MRKSAVIVQARMGSTRLPGKILEKVTGQMTMLELIIERLKSCKVPDEIIVATTDRSQDDVVVRLASKTGVKSFRGSEEDVLDRFYNCAAHFKIDVIIRITSDCPLLDPALVDKMLKRFLASKSGIDYMSNTQRRTYPRGLDVEIITFEVLEKLSRLANEGRQREHVTAYIHQHPELFKLDSVEQKKDLSHLRWTVDEKKDLEFVKEIYKRLYKKNRVFLQGDILKALKEEPYLSEINKDVEQKAINL